MPLLMVISEWRWLRYGRQVDLVLTKRWAKGTAVLFAVGAVSGTVLSFELGLLWPKFMAWAGSIIGMPFSTGGFCVLYGGDLPRYLFVGLGSHFGPGASGGRGSGRDIGGGFGRVRRFCECLDEHTRRISHRGRSAD